MNLVPQQPAEWEQYFHSTDVLFASDDYLAQEKIDGEKLIVSSLRGDLRGFSRSGRPTKLSAKTQAFMPAQGTFIVEGEQGNRLTGCTGFVAFDLIMLSGDDVRHLHYDERLSLLRTLNIPMVESVFGERAKRRLHVSVHAKGGEGIVFKRTDACYQQGRTEKQLKLKNWKSETFVVVGCDGKGIDLQTREGRPAGRCPGFAQAGQLVEVRFQEVTEAGKLRCPTLLGVREDLR
jgi:ATP-dependent DNA ligase